MRLAMGSRTGTRARAAGRKERTMRKQAGWRAHLARLAQLGPAVEPVSDVMDAVCRELGENPAGFVRGLRDELLHEKAGLVVRALVDLVQERDRYDREVLRDGRPALPAHVLACAEELDRQVDGLLKAAECLAKLEARLVPEDEDQDGN